MAQRRRWRESIEPTLGQCVVFAEVDTLKHDHHGIKNTNNSLFVFISGPAFSPVPSYHSITIQNQQIITCYFDVIQMTVHLYRREGKGKGAGL